MGIYGAINAAISGLKAQSYALENISGNIANSQTTGYKRLDTSFSDLVASGGNNQTTQKAGTVTANSRATNDIPGDVQRSDIDTYMAVKGDGYFVVQQKLGETDGRSIFSGNNVYTRRGDFEIDDEGYLVNGAGYYLFGNPIDETTGNVSGTVPELIQITNDFMSARQTTEIEYRGNLPTYPITAQADATSPGSELLDSSITPGNDITANDETAFLRSSLAGEAITIYDENGSPVNVQVRWAKSQNADASAPQDAQWELYYMSDSTATGTDTAWTHAGQFTFDGSGALISTVDDTGTTASPAGTNVTLTNLTVNGNTVGDTLFTFGSDGLTQYADPNGSAKVKTLQQDGYASGEQTGVQISGSGRIIATYNNGQTRDLYEIPIASFNADAWLERLDGGAFAQTSDSGEPLYSATGSVKGNSLEASNTDIADEFSKLIITQQAYSANTRIVTSGDEMLQEALNMVR
ncbi:flagellar hook protein FlgE [Breoghania corrubedonensis]|uniref:Flagellar hook protein FlgE n=1 Tax=Breoghania corrubedonensis TaxID=665038 RepID=A0A2T5VDF7_9HYPH|nr:flagellar hook-basal body complex protein [Breoghania corrubedonensis]PTW61791.1 flagellar hook protein FlgE [Breoghania corrubedonensis]